MPNYTVHTVSYEALIKGTARIVLPEGADPRDYEHLLANHEVNWNIYSIHSREVTRTEVIRTVESTGSGFKNLATSDLLPDNGDTL